MREFWNVIKENISKNISKILGLICTFLVIIIQITFMHLVLRIQTGVFDWQGYMISVIPALEILLVSLMVICFKGKNEGDN